MKVFSECLISNLKKKCLDMGEENHTVQIRKQRFLLFGIQLQLFFNVYI